MSYKMYILSPFKSASRLSGPLSRIILSRSLATPVTSAANININQNNNSSLSNDNNNNHNQINNDNASPEKLAIIADTLTNHLPHFFTASHPLKIYTNDVLFVDNIRSYKIQGLPKYATYIGLVKIYYLIRYSSVKLELLNLVKQPEESCIKIRWRIVTKPGMIQFLVFFWSYKSLGSWKDGISTMHVNKDGKIHCHVCDNIELDEAGNEKKSIKNPFNLAQGLPT